MASYEKRGDTWRCRYREIVDGVEVNKSLGGFKTKREAKEAYEQIVASTINTKKEKKPSTAEDFFDLIQLYLANQKQRMKASSYCDCASKINNHIVPYFGGKKTSKITPKDVLDWQNSTMAEYSFSMRSTCRTYLSSIFLFGERYYGVTNVMRKVEPLRNNEGKKEMTVWTKEQMQEFLAVCDDPFWHALFRFLYVTGCRKGEALALTYSDISENFVRINKSLTRKVEGKPWDITTPKNDSSVRRISIPKSLYDELLKIKTGNFVFGGEAPFADRTIERYFTKYTEMANLPRIRIHDLRHSCASLLISNGLSIVAVANHLGHKDTQQTLNTYAHFMPVEQDRLVRILDEV